MIRLIIFLVVTALLAWMAVWLAESPGTVTLSWEVLGGTYEVPVGLGIAIVALIAAASILAYEVWRWLSGMPRRVRENRRQKRRVRGFNELASGLMAAAAGDVAGARVHSKQAEKLLGDAPATLLLSAQTAQLEGKEDVAQLKFRQMLKRPETEFLGLRGLLAEAVKRGDQDEALELARRAHQRSPNTPWVLTTLFDLLTRSEQWEEALQLVGDLSRQKLFSQGEGVRRRGLLNHKLAEQAAREERWQDALRYGRQAVQRLPGFAPAAVNLARVAVQLQKVRQARKVLEQAWRVEPHPEIANAYAALYPSETAVERLKRFGRLADMQPGHVVTHLILAELAMSAKHWETARKHLDKAMEIGGTAGAHRLYAEYERASGGGEAKAREWLAKAVDAPADKAWVCDDTGEVLPHWELFGPSGRFDTVHWDHPPKVAQLAAHQKPAFALSHEDLDITRAPVPVASVSGPEAAPKDKGDSAGDTAAVSREAAARSTS